MNTRQKHLRCLVFAILTGFIAIFFVGLGVMGMASRVELVAQEDLAVYRDVSGESIIGKIKESQLISVIGCVDVKHYIVPVVVINGSTGFILDGKFSIVHKSILSGSMAPISFSCG